MGSTAVPNYSGRRAPHPWAFFTPTTLNSMGERQPNARHVFGGVGRESFVRGFYHQTNSGKRTKIVGI